MPSKTIVTCALTGSADTPSRNAAVPVTPEAIAASAIDAAKAGASVVHIHVRDPVSAKASMDLELYRQVCDRIRQSGIDLVINLTTGPGQRFMPGRDDPKVAGPGTTLTTPEVRIRHVVELQPELCSLDVATMNYGSAFGDVAMINTLASLEAMATGIRSAGTKPELEVFDLGHIALANHLIATGFVDRPPFFQLCLGIQWGAPWSPATLQHMVSLLPSDAIWAAFGVGPNEFAVVAEAVVNGGHVRVGLEDNLYLSRGNLAPSNAALVERAVEIIERLGGSIASAADARQILHLGR